MIIGIDGNEANVVQRVGSNQYAYELLKAIYGQLSVVDSPVRDNSATRYVIYLRDRPLQDMPKPKPGWAYRVIKPRKLWTQIRLPIDLYFHRPRPDVFFTAGHYSPRWSPIPRVISIMDLGFLKFPDQFTQKDRYQLTAWTERSARLAKHIFAISESTKNAIIEAYGISEKKITVTYPGYNKDKFKNLLPGDKGLKVKISGIEKKYGITGKYILFLSTLKPSKNIEGLLAAYKILKTDTKLVIAGKKGWLFDTIYNKSREYGLANKVIFTDFIDEEDVPLLMAGAQVFTLPSYWEGFGIPVVEAMAVGCPVVVSNAGSLPEIVGDAGIIVDPYQPEEIARGITKAIENRKDLIKKGFKQINKFSWDKCAQKTVEVLNNFLKNV